jgi:hypothetical protein
MNNMMMQAMQAMQQIQEKMAEVQEGLKTKTVTETGGDGMVSVTVSGELRVTAVEVNMEKIGEEEKDVVEDLLTATINRALAAAEEMKNREMEAATGGMLPNIPGLNIPGLF